MINIRDFFFVTKKCMFITYFLLTSCSWSIDRIYDFTNIKESRIKIKNKMPCDVNDLTIISSLDITLNGGERRVIRANEYHWFPVQRNPIAEKTQVKSMVYKNHKISKAAHLSVIQETKVSISSGETYTYTLKDFFIKDLRWNDQIILPFLAWRVEGGTLEVEFNFNPSVIEKRFFELEDELSSFVYRPHFTAPEWNANFNQIVKQRLHENKPINMISYSTERNPSLNSFLVSMVKDEDDVIYENLCWHYFMGFRNFLIIDNGSTDKTVDKINLFKFNKPNTNVIFIEDSRLAYKQTSRMNAAYKLIEEFFPECQWIFPNDADEFIVFEDDIETTLSKIPSQFNAVYSQRLTYKPHEDYDYGQDNKDFYKKLKYVHISNSNRTPANEFSGKCFFRTQKGLLPVQGNHFLSQESKETSNYIWSLDVGINIREYPLRSMEHARKKIINMGLALARLREVDDSPKFYSDERYENYLKFGEVAITKTFNDSFSEQSDELYLMDPLLINCVLSGKFIQISESHIDRYPSTFFEKPSWFDEVNYNVFFGDRKKYEDAWFDFISQPMGITTDIIDNDEIIVSLTTHPPRIHLSWMALESIMRQTKKPHKILLRLAETDFPDKSVLPEFLSFYERRGLEIKFSDNLRSATKLIPTIKEYPNAAVITIDDDICYPETRLAVLLDAHKKHPNCVISFAVNEYISSEYKKISPELPYFPIKTWEQIEAKEMGPSSLLEVMGVYGALYPPHCFDSRIFELNFFFEHLYTHDDLFFMCMLILNGTQVVKPENDCAVQNRNVWANETPADQVCNLRSSNLSIVTGGWKENIDRHNAFKLLGIYKILGCD